ncbi:MAG: helix-turn-helix domain-containing protein [Chania sp.]
MRKIDELSSILKQRRRELNWNQKDFLMAIGMTQQQYQRLESGSDMRLSTLLKVLEAMGLECVIVPKARVKEAVALGQQQAGKGLDVQSYRELEALLQELEDR